MDLKSVLGFLFLYKIHLITVGFSLFPAHCLPIGWETLILQS